MDRERIELIVRNMELLVNALKEELKETDNINQTMSPYIDEYEPDYYEED